MSIFGTKCHHNFAKLPEMDVYYIHFQTIEKKLLNSSAFFLK